MAVTDNTVSGYEPVGYIAQTYWRLRLLRRNDADENGRDWPALESDIVFAQADGVFL